ncbi:MAG: tetratricopeptide repeat protein, partial [Ferruginibacter sp.]
MLFRCAYLNISRTLLQFAFIFIMVEVFYVPVMAQEKLETSPSHYLPSDYFSLNTDLKKIHFLEKSIKDSLDKGQLTRIYDWAKIGLGLAAKNNIDTMKGVFIFFMAKAFAYEYLKPDSAIFLYKRVLPFFPDKMNYYNVISVREIMERYCELGNKDSSLRYLDSLNALIDTLSISSPRRVSLSQNIATTYQWFGMFNTAIHYFQIAVNGQRKNGNITGLGIALANLAELYSESADDIKALQYSKEALGYLKGMNMPYIMTAINIATYYTNFKQYDSALLYLKKAEILATD